MAVGGEKCGEVLTNYFSHLGSCCYEKAREIISQERDALKNQQGTPYQHLLNVCSQLTGSEKQFMALSFLQQRGGGFLRKEPILKTVLSNLESELTKLRGQPDLIGEIALLLSAVVTLRISLIEVFEKLANVVDDPIPVGSVKILGKFLCELSDLKGLNQSIVEPWCKSLTWETGALLSSLSAMTSIQEFDMFSSILHLQQVGESLNAWEEVIGSKESSRKMGFASSLLRGVVASTTEPQLFLWLQKFKGSLVSKFSLYFHQQLSKQTTVQEMKNLCGKLSLDQPSRISLNQKKLDAMNISILFDASSLDYHWSGVSGYRHLERQPIPKSGMDLFPLVFSSPGPLPPHYLPSLVMLLSGARQPLTHLYDPGAASTYFLCRLETNFVMVVVCEGKRAERDSAVISFLTETVQQIRMGKIFALLKTGIK